MNLLRELAALTKIRIAGLSTVTAGAGYILFAGRWEWGLLPACAGVLALACGSCAFNEVQERALDARMPRTEGRPLPAGRIGVWTAMAVAAILIIAGFLVLRIFSGWTPALLGLAAVFWYNGVYTFLKRVTPFAAVPGALIGALPPAIGWTAAGGGAGDPQMLALAFFLFLWQVPHFWLLWFLFASQYKEAGLPTILERFRPDSLARLVFTWSLAAAVSSLLIPFFGPLPVWATCALAAAGIGLVLSMRGIVSAPSDPASYRSAFRVINLYALVVVALLFAGALGRG